MTTTRKIPTTVRRVRLLAACVLGLPAGPAVAQVPEVFSDPDYAIDAWGVEQGLPENAARAMVQTPDGYLWIATYNGLVRFDGLGFAVFHPRNTPGLPSKAIVNLHLDAARRLWVSTTKGLVVSEADRQDTFQPAPGWTGNYVRTVAEAAGVLCLTSFDGKVFRATDGRCEQLPPRPGGLAGATAYALVDRAGHIHVAQRGFFGRWDGRQWIPTAPAGLALDEIRGAAVARDGALLLATRTELFRGVEGLAPARVQLAEPLPAVWQIAEDSRGDCWVTTPAAGLLRVAPDGSVQTYTAGRGSLTNALRFVFEDRERNIWVGGVSGGGLLRFRRRTFRLFNAATAQALPVTKALLEEAPGRLLLGTYGRGVARLDTATGAITPDAFGPGLNYYVQGMLRDRRGQTWIATFGQGIQIFTPTGRREIASADCGGLDVNALFEDSRGRVWIGGSETAVRYAEGRFTAQRQAGGEPLPHVIAFAESPADGGLWAATSEHGLFRQAGETWQPVPGPDGKALSGVLCLKCERDGTLWMGGGGVGLLRWREGRWSAIGVEQGLPRPEISAIVEDGLGFWWLGHGRGALRASRADIGAVADRARATLPLLACEIAGHLPSVEFEGGLQNVALRDAGGRVWFATTKGAATIDPRNFEINRVPPPIVVESFRVEDRWGRMTTHRVGGAARLVVPPGAREISIAFTALCFAAPQKARFAGRIDGLDEDWRDLGAQRSLNLFRPPPGDYRLRLKAANNDGVWNEQGVTVPFSVQPHYWETWWFRLLATTALTAAVALAGWQIARSRLRRQIARLEEQRVLAHERAQFVAVAESTSDLVGFADATGLITYINPAGRRLLGLRPHESLAGKTIVDFHPRRAAERVTREGVPVARRDGVWSGDTALLHREGREIPVSQVIMAHHGPDGRLDFLSTIARDMTERKQAEEKIQQLNAGLEQRVAQRTAELEELVTTQRELMRTLRASEEATARAVARLQQANAKLLVANEELEAFSYSVSHDLRAPLRNITGFLELLSLRSARRLDPEERRYVETVAREAGRMGTLIDQLLQFSRIGRSELRWEAVDPAALVAEVCADLERESSGRVLQWKIGALPAVRGDRALLRQVFANLLGNAVKFTRHRNLAVIEIGALAPPAGGAGDGLTAFFVRDNGAGFNPKYADKLFGVFQRLHNQRDFEGTGIGLANVKRIVTRHGGRVWAVGSVDHGATFYVALKTVAT
jgi:PAS domain S-box-containing protein